jgi:hypothetical protein
MSRANRLYLPASLAFVSGCNVIAVELGVPGYFPVHTGMTADDLNGFALSGDVARSAVMGSMFGWHVPGARAAVDFFEARSS